MSRGVEGRDIFSDDLDRNRFLEMIADAKKAHGFHVFAYCLMGNHFHLLTQVGDSPLYSGMHHFLTRYSHHFNQRHTRRGHLFQSRYAAPLCRQDSYLRTLLRYVHMNPVRAGLVEHPKDWPWSGHNGLMGTTSDSLLDMSQLANLRSESLAELRLSYGESIAQGAKIAPFAEYANDPGMELPNIPALQEIACAAAREHGLSMDELCGGRRGKAISPAKLVFIETAQRYGYRLRDVAATLNCSPAAVTLLRRRKS